MQPAIVTYRPTSPTWRAKCALAWCPCTVGLGGSREYGDVAVASPRAGGRHFVGKCRAGLGASAWRCGLPGRVLLLPGLRRLRTLRLRLRAGQCVADLVAAILRP